MADSGVPRDWPLGRCGRDKNDEKYVKTDLADYKYAESFIEYFKRYVESSPLFRIEAEVAETVVRIMKKQTHTRDDIRAIKEHMRNIDNEEHYDGSGWYGFKNAVCSWLEARAESEEE